MAGSGHRIGVVARSVVERLARDGYVRSRPRIGTVVLPRDLKALRSTPPVLRTGECFFRFHDCQVAPVISPQYVFGATFPY